MTGNPCGLLPLPALAATICIQYELYLGTRAHWQWPGRNLSSLRRRSRSSTTHENDPRFLPWRDLAARLGYRSVAALPLRCDGKLTGALTIYAGEPDAFDSEEIGLLEELAEDLSYGLELLMVRQSQARAEVAVLQATSEFRTVIDSTNDAIFIADFSGRLLAVNQPVSTLTSPS